MKNNKKKRIKILSNGVISVYGHINGPVLTPYYEDISVIVKLITSGVKVVEVADNGSESLLTVSSVLAEEKEEENNEVKEEKVEEPVKEEVVEEVAVVEEPESSDEQVVEETAPTTNKEYSSNYNYKKNNKHKK